MLKILWIALLSFLITACAGKQIPEQNKVPPSASSDRVEAGNPYAVVSGKIAYGEQITLKPDSLVRVVLLEGDRSSGQMTSEVKEQIFRTDYEQPLRFELKYPRASITLDKIYGIQAHIFSADERLIFTMPVPVQVFKHDSAQAIQDKNITLMLERVPFIRSGQKNKDPASQAKVYRCPNLLFSTSLHNGDLALYLPDEMLMLKPSANSEQNQYRHGDTLFLSQGGKSMLSWNGTIFSHCLRQPELESEDPLVSRPIVFRAVGNNPDWLLEVEQNYSINLLMDYGQIRYSWPAGKVDNVSQSYWQLPETFSTPMADVRVSQELCKLEAHSNISRNQIAVTLISRDGQKKTLTGCGHSLLDSIK
ncbi:YbaY family lipoprotein [Oceanospirillum sediminis]|uniref:YbaY family lipoprotein n=1 Tax=Oceanospirillum sediminis TaxID=2760088 RepID=A0A839IWE3_9GAMM|nr:YbaY family lipoprotein [Oceanospirillum sediminis]MBB1489010.1 YbaY family lipoprotein [Oceanospirillum sediminis]